LAKIPTTAPSPIKEERGEPRQSTLVRTATTYDIASDASQKMSVDSLITVIELAIIILHEAPPSSVDQTRAKRLLLDALNLHPEGFTALKTDQSMSNVDWETLLSVYIGLKGAESEDQKTVSTLSKKNLDDWFRGLGDYYQELLLDVLVP
jgi:hypothetical protein